MKKIFVFIFLFCVLSLNVSALCYDDSLNEWAIDTNIKFIDFNRNLINEVTNEPLYKTMDYSYILTLDNYRDDIVIKASADYGEELEGIYVPGHKVYGIVDYTPKNGATYDIKIYGAKGSVCENELLKTFTYKVEPFNFYYKTEECEDYPEAPLCAIYKDTSNITEKEFKEEMKAYIESVNPVVDNPSLLDIFLSYLKNYGIYVLIPIIVFSILFIKKIHIFKKHERKK